LKEEAEKINQADSLVFQTEKQLKEYGDKISEGLKKPIEDACEQLKKAHADRNMPEIDAAMAALNQAWEAASGEMYKATQEGEAAQGAPNQPGGNGGDEVTDVDFEEVK
jgi:molecular chaperone DnaK